MNHPAAPGASTCSSSGEESTPASVSGKPPFRALSWRGAFHPVFLLSCAAILAINWVVPAEWIEGSRTAAAYSEFVRERLLQVSHHADIWAHARTTQFARAALFSHALTWTLALLVVLYNFSSVAINWKAWAGFWLPGVWEPAPRKTRVILATFGLFVLAVFWAATMMPGSTEHMASADLRSRFVLGLMSAFVFILWHLTALSYAVMSFAFVGPLLRKDRS